MMQRTLQREIVIPRPRDEVFEFFADATNLENVTPPWLRFKVLTPAPIEMKPGALLDYKLSVHGLPIRWRTEILEWDPPHRFIDRQLRGPYRLWHHEHIFEECETGTRMTDRVTYRCPGWIFEPLVHALFIGPDLRRIFDFRTAAFEEAFGLSESAPAT